MVKAAGKYYADVIRHETLRKRTSVTAEDLIKAISETYRIASGGDKEDSDDDSVKETSLVTGVFPYKCYNCGEQGHITKDCPEKKKKRRPGKFTGACDLCGEIGHRKKDCWEDQVNANKRP